jgi:hypothetical protein
VRARFSPDVKVQEGSQLAGKVGKIPSMFNGRGEAHGLTGWQKREIAPSEVAYWQSDRRLNMCVRTRPDLRHLRVRYRHRG